jgi:hypothetical protein
MADPSVPLTEKPVQGKQIPRWIRRISAGRALLKDRTLKIDACRYSYQTLSHFADGSKKANKEDSVIIVGWATPDDELNPANWGTTRKVSVTLLVSLIGAAVTAASAIDASGIAQYTAEFHAAEVVAALPTGKHLLKNVPPSCPLLFWYLLLTLSSFQASL